MAVEDFLESEVAVAVVATAAIFSPPVRKVLRRGAVYGLAGLLIARDAVISFGRGVGNGVQQATTKVTASAHPTAEHVNGTVATDGSAGGVA